MQIAAMRGRLRDVKIAMKPQSQDVIGPAKSLSQ
jgi:hypothetical protein